MEMEKVALYAAAAYPFLHGLITIVAKYMPAPDKVSSVWYPVLYQVLQYCSIGPGRDASGKSNTSSGNGSGASGSNASPN